MLTRVQVVDTFSPVACIHFDAVEALIWLGTENGRVLSLSVPQLSLHTSGYASVSAVRGIVSTANGIVVLADLSLSLRSRTSLRASWTLAIESIGGFSPLGAAFSAMAVVGSDLLVSTSLGTLVVVGIKSGTVLRFHAQPDGATPPYVIMRTMKVSSSPAPILVCATAAGAIHLRDTMTSRVISRFEAHSGAVSDIDISSYSCCLATTGYSLQRPHMIPDSCIKLWDLRNPNVPKLLQSVPGVRADATPTFVRFGVGGLGTSTTNWNSRCVFASQTTGELFGWDSVSGRANVDTGFDTALDGYMTSMEFSSTGDFLAFASSSGTVSLWTDKDDPEVPQVNAYERDSITVDLLPEIIQVSDDAPLSSVGMPYYTEQLLSATWPGDLFFDITCPPQRIPKEVLAQVKMSDFVGYAKNPGIGFRRNQSSKSILLQMQNQANLEGEMPKFRSEQERESLIGKGGKKGIAAFGNSPILESSGSFGIIPKPYRRVQIKYSKFGIEDFDFAFFNKSAATRSGLETHIKNSYTNSLLQLLFYTQPLRRIAAAHISTMCVKLQSVCMLCELGFLFRMLEEAKGANCQAGNFLHAFGKVVQAGALGLFEQDLHTAAVPTTGGASSIVPQQDVVAMIQGFHRFILETLSGEGGAGVPGFIKDVNETDGGGVTLVQQAMGLRWRNVSRCNGCGVEEDKDTVTFVLEVAHKAKANDNILNVPSFPTLLNATLQKEASSKAWCIHCNKFNNLFQSKCLHDLPNLIAINLKMVLHEAVIGDPAMETWIPHRIALVITEGKVSSFDLAKDSFNIDEFQDSVTAVYDLKGVVAEIKNPDDKSSKAHLVSHLLVDSESEWLLFNDFSVQPIASNDVSRFETWKSPSILQYTRVDLETRVDYTTLTTAGTLEHLLIHNPLSNSRRDLLINYTPLTDAELPIKPGFVVAIDAEFVALQKEETEIRSDGSRSTILPSKMGLARVSVLRGYDGPMAGVPFIDDYIEVQDDIVDYLTEYSGISAGNLDPSTSIHPLVTLKVAYQKLRYLVDCGCVFVGHGLKKDFRTINIIIPPEQIIDTVDIYFIKERQRKLSLRFLAWSVLRQEIQQDTHDSIEDARTALLLYKRYLELSRQGIFQQVLEDVYEEGKQFNFKPPTSGGFS